jgi:hypothetical protein
MMLLAALAGKGKGKAKAKDFTTQPLPFPGFKVST